MSNIVIKESVGKRLERVHTYEDLEIHHPSKQGREPGRSYAIIDGENEEINKARTSAGNRMVSKDFILFDEKSGAANIRIPSPVAGYVGRVDPSGGTVEIYDRKGGELLTRIRHMDLRGSGLEVGDTVQYGQPLGKQSGFGGGRADKYGVHAHVDFNEAHLDKFKQYIRDMDTGVITTQRYPNQQTVNAADIAGSGGRANAMSDGVLRHGERGDAVKALQSELIKQGFVGKDGKPLTADGVFGSNTEHAVKEFQKKYGLDDDGIAGSKTLSALKQQPEVEKKNEETTMKMSDPNHPDHKLFSALSSRLPGMPEERIVQATIAAKAANINDTQINKTIVYGDKLYVTSNVPTIRAEVDLNKPVPDTQELQRQNEEVNSQLQARQQIQHHSPGMMV